jgi:ADP-ribose pyrophosphatase YjhB (NUDIX family)
VREVSSRLEGVRPLGGTVELGERRQAALKREFAEELGIEIGVGTLVAVFENLYTNEAVPGHEIVFVATINLPAGFAQTDAPIPFRDHDGASCLARWIDVSTADSRSGPDLYPIGLRCYLPGLIAEPPD